MPALTFTLKVLVYLFIYDRFAKVYAHCVALSLSNEILLITKAVRKPGKIGQTGDKTDFKYIIGVINGRNELDIT